MFLINSRLGHFTAPQQSWGPFIPKLQGQFAEFLGHDSLEHLRILSPTTCVGLRYGQYKHKFRSFSWKSDYGHYPLIRRLVVLSPSTKPADFPTGPISTGFNVNIRCHADLSLLRHSITVYTGTGILTSYPSTFPFGYVLGPD